MYQRPPSSAPNVNGLEHNPSATIVARIQNRIVFTLISFRRIGASTAKAPREEPARPLTRASDQLLPLLGRLAHRLFDRGFAGLPETLAVQVTVAKGGVDRRQALEVVADVQLVGHTHATVQLYRLLAHEAASAADELLGGRNRASAFG